MLACSIVNISVHNTQLCTSYSKLRFAVRDVSLTKTIEESVMLKFYVSAVEKLQAFKDESGATAIEYGLIAAGIAVAIIVAVGLLGDELAILFNSISSEI